MSPRSMALQAGVQRGLIELRQSLSNVQDLWGLLFFPLITLIIMVGLRDNTVPGTGFSLSTYSVPGILGITVVLNGMMAMALALSVEREDGTLLRAKATPNGMIGYLTGKIVSRAGLAVLSLLIPLVPAALIFDGLELGRVSAWLTLIWVLGIGLAAVLPIGACLGSLFQNPQSVGFVTIPVMLLMSISGVFYPISEFPAWTAIVAQVFPFYWLALGLRSAMLPDVLAAVELGGSWQSPATLLVLAGWALVGLALAPALLRRMARRESGSALSGRRQRALQRMPS